MCERNKIIVVLLLFFFTVSWSQISKSPNVIIILIDDMGYSDLSCFGGKTPTPNIDQLAQKGKMFTQYYSSAPVCSPSRVGLLTGTYPIRWNINTFLSNKKFNADCEQSDFLSTNAPSIAKELKNKGYTTAHFGKWHLGGGRDVTNAPVITEYGFDEFSSTYESPNPDPLLTATNWIWSPTDSIKRWNRTAYFVDKTLEFFKKNTDKPCFVNLWPDDVHSPWVPSEQLQNDKTTYKTFRNLNPVIKELDIQIGRLVEGLKVLGIEKHTLIILTSDNGPDPSFNRERTHGLRGLKNSLYEGGIAMPFIASWPGTIKAGQVDSLSVIDAVDLFPTICSITKSKIKSNYSLDGEDFSKTLKTNKTFIRKKDLFWEYGRNESFNYPEKMDRSLQLATRHGNWKLLTTPDGSKVELYDLSKDPNETTNVSNTYVELAESLKHQTMEWFKKNDKEFNKR